MRAVAITFLALIVLILSCTGSASQRYAKPQINTVVPQLQLQRELLDEREQIRTVSNSQAFIQNLILAISLSKTAQAHLAADNTVSSTPLQTSATIISPKVWPKTDAEFITHLTGKTPWVHAVRMFLLFVIALLSIYTLRHYVFTLQRLYGKQRHLYSTIEHAAWPRIAVLIAAHNEEAVIGDILQALIAADYPQDRLVIIPMNDRSKDNTKNIIDHFAAIHPQLIQAFHRSSGKPGKAAALKDTTEIIKASNLADVIMVFDADYLPSRGLLKHLAVPFLDPEVGAVMGRVVPQNAGSNLLTRVLDLERAGGYQVDQTARQNIGAVPQYGGTVGGIRLSALANAGGWHDDVLAEDTDLTFRLLLSGWKTIYLNKAECYEEVPESWAVRARQISRWAKGHNQALVRHLWPLMKSSKLNAIEKLDGAALLGVYMMSPLLLLSWALVLILFYAESGFALGGALAVLTVISCAAFGNSAAFFQVAVASHIDGKREGIKLLPFMMVGFLVSSVSISLATWQLFITDRLFKRKLNWEKTLRYRNSAFAQSTYGHSAYGRAAYAHTGNSVLQR